MENHKISKYIVSKYTVLTIQVAASIAIVVSVARLDILPFRYLCMLIVGVILLLVLPSVIMFWSDKKEKGKKTGIFAKISSIVISILLVFTTSYIIRGNQFIKNISNKTIETRTISVRVLKDSHLESLQDLQDLPCGVSYQHDSKNIAQAVADFEEDKGSTIVLEKKDTYMALADALYQGDVEAIVMGNEYISLVEDRYEHFYAETREIATFKITSEMGTTIKDANVTEETFTIYLTGNDNYGDITTVSRSDVNLLVTINPVTKQILMVSIPRDTQITLASNGEMDKLTHTGLYGTSETIATIENFLDIDINYYARTNFTGVIEIVDQLGGIVIDYPNEGFTMTHGNNYRIVQGINEMDGDMALCFVRERKTFLDGDFERGRNQQRLLKAMIEKAMSPKIITNFNNILSAIEGTFETNMSSNSIRALLNMQLDDMSDWEFLSIQVEAISSEYTTEAYSSYGSETSIEIPNPYVVETVQELLDKITSGQLLTKEEVEDYNIDEITTENIDSFYDDEE